MSRFPGAPTGPPAWTTPSTPASGFPLVTGPAELATPVNHVLPAWDVACGIYAALAVTAALRHRDATGEGARISIPLENVALATAGNLSFLTEVMVNGTGRERIGNSVYGQYGQDFTSSDGASFMVVALTGRHFRDLTEITGTTKAVAALAEALGADFTDEGDRYRHRDALSGLFTEWFAEHTASEICAALSATSVLWERYRTFSDVVTDDRVTANRLVHPAGSTADRGVPGAGPAHVDRRCLSAGGGCSRARRRHGRRAGRLAGDGTGRRSAGSPNQERWQPLPPMCRADEHAARTARPAAGQRPRHLDRERQRPGRQARVRRAVHRAEPGRRLPHRRSGTAADQHASAVPARRRRPRTRRVHRRAGFRRPDGGGPPRRLASERAAADHGDRIVGRRRGRSRTWSALDDAHPSQHAAAHRTGRSGTVDAVGRTRHPDRRRRVERRVRAATLVAGNRTRARGATASHADRGVCHRRVHDRSRVAGARAFDEGPQPSQWHDRFVDLVSPTGARRSMESPGVHLTGRCARTRCRHRQPDPRRRRHRRARWCRRVSSQSGNRGTDIAQTNVWARKCEGGSAKRRSGDATAWPATA